MRIECDNARIAKYFEDFEYMRKKCGSEITKTIKKMHNILTAAGNFSMYLKMGLGKPHRLNSNLDKMYGITITGNIRLIVEPAADDLTEECLAKCDTVIIKGVADYHGKKCEWIIP